MIRRGVASMIGLVAGMAILAGATAAQSSLSEVPRITEGLIAAAIAYEIGDKCDTIDARLLRGMAFLEGLRDHARSLGYSEEAIRAYMEDRGERERLKDIARARFAAMGGVEGVPETYCAVGRAEIAAGSEIGRLLR